MESRFSATAVSATLLSIAGTLRRDDVAVADSHIDMYRRPPHHHERTSSMSELSLTTSPRKSMPRNARPVARQESVVQGDHWRFTVLTDSLIRVEWSDSGVFEDHCTQMVVDRDFEPAADIHMRQYEQDGLLVIDTPDVRLTYDRKPFTKEGLQTHPRAWMASAAPGISATTSMPISAVRRARWMGSMAPRRSASA